jgi:hypothetical protein
MVSFECYWARHKLLVAHLVAKRNVSRDPTAIAAIASEVHAALSVTGARAARWRLSLRWPAP